MLGEEVEAVADELGFSALGEIANMITGNASTHLAELGYDCDITPPVIIEPAGSKVTTLGRAQINVTFVSDLGRLIVRISLKEATNGV